MEYGIRNTSMRSGMIRFDKSSMLDEVKSSIKDGQAIFIFRYKGLRTSELEELRKTVRLSGKVFVCKNSILKVALKDISLEKAVQFVEGPSAIAVSTTDPCVLSKDIIKFASNHPACVVLGGVLGKEVLTASVVKQLAGLPSRQEILGQVAWTAQSAVYHFIWTLNGIICKFLYVVEQIKNIPDRKAE
ncbi:50S ribosomal protein L10 [bacterium Unc6]|nr:50S ribosomal protein L10 [bacterium Unc6]